MHTSFEQLVWAQREGYREAVVLLGKGDSSYEPTCPTCKVWGPARVVYRQYADGGVDGLVEALSLSDEAQLALRSTLGLQAKKAKMRHRLLDQELLNLKEEE